MSGIKFSNTTPAAPSGKSLVTFQADGQGFVSAAYSGPFTTLVAGMNINSFQVVTVHSDGKAYVADRTTSADSGRVIGIAVTSALTGGNVTIQQSGEVDNTGGWFFTPGDTMYLDTTGALTASVPTTGFELPMGVARSAGTLMLGIGTPIVLV